MFCKPDDRRKSIVTLALSQGNRKIIVRHFVNRAPELPREGEFVGGDTSGIKFVWTWTWWITTKCALIAAAMRPFVKLLLETVRGVVLKKKWGTPETRLRQRFLNNLGLHTRTLIHVTKLPQRIFGLVLRYSYSCLSVCSRSILILLYWNYLTLRFSK